MCAIIQGLWARYKVSDFTWGRRLEEEGTTDSSDPTFILQHLPKLTMWP